MTVLQALAVLASLDKIKAQHKGIYNAIRREAQRVIDACADEVIQKMERMDYGRSSARPTHR